MSGIYIHIPFCKQACHYCDFHFSTFLKTKNDLLKAILVEIEIQKSYLPSSNIDTLYFGGGTPSLLEVPELSKIIDQVRKHFNCSNDLELTLEANPDDLTNEKLVALKHAGFNRLSIGIQSFEDRLLKFFNRSHDATMAKESVLKAQKIGFNNISIDLIFGVPDQSLSDLEKDLEKAISLNTQHISIYGLTIEEKTAFGKWHKSGKLHPLNEEIAAQHFELIMKTLVNAGFKQYEISNFAKPGFESKHNSSYWQGKEYLGIGPSAHSFNNTSRQSNVANNANYIKSLKERNLPCSVETLSKEEQINETILIQLRTSQGLDLGLLKEAYSFDLKARKKQELNYFLESHKVLIENNFLKITDSGKLLADFITEKLII